MVQFAPLDVPTIKKVVGKLIVELQTQLEPKDVEIEVDGKAIDWLVEHGYDKTMGARPMSRILQQEIKRELADELLFGKLQKGGRVNVTVVKGQLRLKFKKSTVSSEN